MSSETTPPRPAAPQPMVPVQKGYQPRPAGQAIDFPSLPQGGHQPTTGNGAPTNPPNQGSGGKK
jgi:hypothetical protein